VKINQVKSTSPPGGSFVLDPAAIAWIIVRTAPTWLPIVAAGSGLYTDYRARAAAAAAAAAAALENAAHASQAASEATARAQEAIRDAAQNSSIGSPAIPRTFEIPSNAFNASHEFTSVLSVAAIIGTEIAANTIQPIKELKKIGIALESIQGEMEEQTAAKVQGWEKEGYGAFIYKFLKDEIDEFGGDATVGRHTFYIYNPTPSANIVFKERVREQPLPASLDGMCSDIEAVFLLMWMNRQTLHETMPKERADDTVRSRKYSSVYSISAIHTYFQNEVLVRNTAAFSYPIPGSHRVNL